LAERGVPFYVSHAIRKALGKTEVESIILVRLGDADEPVPGGETTIACDTVVTAIGIVPNVELLDVLGCQLQFRSERGGYVPILDEDGAASVPCVHVIGDCAGISDDRIADLRIAVSEGRRIGAVVARALGAVHEGPVQQLAEAPPASPAEVHGHWQRWLRAEIAAGGLDVNICQCEEVTRRELVELRPPRYLNWGSSQMQARSLETLAKDGPINQDQVKRLTRAGMGPCQGRRCREQVQMLLAATANVAVSDIPLASYRAPVRPLPLSVLWPHDEPKEVRDNWAVWFDIPTQFTPHWEMAAVSPSISDVTTTRPEAIGLGDDGK
jgi:Pyridine nucleotide-disulphide oxidoreductase/Sarcosine oxidase A3 domain